MLLWHYTTERNLRSLMRKGSILPSTSIHAASQKPIVWFSANQFWEQSANQDLTIGGIEHQLTMEGMLAYGGGLARIGVAPETVPHDWAKLKRLANISERQAKRLTTGAVNRGADPAEWYGTFESVPRKNWLVVEVFRDGAWKPLARDGTGSHPATRQKAAKRT
jgi:hypothetical protein